MYGASQNASPIDPDLRCQQPGWDAAGPYREWSQELEIHPEGKIVVAGTSFLAGSWAFTDTCIGNMVRYGGVSLAEAIGMATDQPRRLLGLPVQSIAVGQPADLVLFEIGHDVNVIVQSLVSPVA